MVILFIGLSSFAQYKQGTWHDLSEDCEWRSQYGVEVEFMYFISQESFSPENDQMYKYTISFYFRPKEWGYFSGGISVELPGTKMNDEAWVDYTVEDFDFGTPVDNTVYWTSKVNFTETILLSKNNSASIECEDIHVNLIRVDKV